MNHFFEKQNESSMLLLLAGQRQIYSDVKKLLMKCFVVGVIIPSLLSFAFFILSFYPEHTIPWMKTLLTIYGVVFLVINHFMMEHIGNCKKKAARIQEEFDTRLYDMEWNNIAAGKKVPLSETTIYAQRYLDAEGDSSLRDWYLNAPLSVPPMLMVLLCQSKNMSWDANLKSKTSFYLSVIFALNIIMFAMVLIFANPSFLEFMAFLAIVLPIIQFYYRYVSDNKKSVVRADELRNCVESFLSQVEENKVCDEHRAMVLSRSIQDQIFSYRAAGNPVPDFVHKRNRIKDEEKYDRIFNVYMHKLKSIS